MNPRLRLAMTIWNWSNACQRLRDYRDVENAMIEVSDELPEDDLDPRVGMAMMNEIMAEDDKDDPYLDSY